MIYITRNKHLCIKKREKNYLFIRKSYVKTPYNNLNDKYVICTSPLIEYQYRENVELLCIPFFGVIKGLMGYQFAVCITLYRGVHVEVNSFLCFLKVSYNHVIVIDACIIFKDLFKWNMDNPSMHIIHYNFNIHTAQVCPVLIHLLHV